MDERIMMVRTRLESVAGVFQTELPEGKGNLADGGLRQEDPSRIVCRIPPVGDDGYRQMSESDIELLARYRQDRSEEAFSEIARRHLALVHSAALRQVRLPQLAEEIAQATFLELARQADRLEPTTQLAAWLYEATRRNAVDVLRRESRRDARERTAMELNSLNAGPSEWSQLELVLDDAMAELPSTDRTAILLRYFESRSLRDVGAALGVSDDAAQKRVSRAVDELRTLLAKRGVTVGASALIAVISDNAVQAAPAALAVAVAACSAKVVVSTAVPPVAMTAFTKSLLATSAISLAVGIHQWVQANRLKEEVRQFAAQTTELAAKTEELTHERDEATRRAALTLGDLAVLRGEVEKQRSFSAKLVSLKTENGALKRVMKGMREGPGFTGRTQLSTLQFRVDAKAMLSEMDRVLGSNPAQDSGTRLRSFMERLGVSLEPPSSLFFNEKSGVIAARAPVKDLETIQTAFELINSLDPAGEYRMLQDWAIRLNEAERKLDAERKR